MDRPDVLQLGDSETGIFGHEKDREINFKLKCIIRIINFVFKFTFN